MQTKHQQQRPRLRIASTSPQRLYFVEITRYQNPSQRTYYATPREAAEAYAEAVDAIAFYEDVAQVRQGQQLGRARTITQRFTNL